MSEPQKVTGEAFSHGPIKGEKAEDFEAQFAAEPEQEVVEPEAEAPAEEVQPAQEAVPEESEADRLVREATERLSEAAKEVAPPSELSMTQREIQELKAQIAQMGKAQQVPEPERGADLSVLDDPGVQEQIRLAKESDDPNAWARAQAIIAQHMVEAQGNPKMEALERKLEATLGAIQQQQRAQYSRQKFEEGLSAAKSMGGVPEALVKQFEANQELPALDAHVRAGGTLEDYAPRSILGAWLLGRDQSTNQPNVLFAGSPTLMKAGVGLLAQELTRASSPEVASVSTTAAGAPSRGGGMTNSGEEELSPEEQILKGVLDAAEHRRSKGKAFGL